MKITSEEVAENTEGLVRVVGRAVGHLVTTGEEPDQEQEAIIKVAILTAGLDPDDCDRSSDAYRYGAQDALAAVVNTYEEYREAMEAKREAERAEWQAKVSALEDELSEIRARTPIDTSRSRPSGLGG